MYKTIKVSIMINYTDIMTTDRGRQYNEWIWEEVKGRRVFACVCSLSKSVCVFHLKAWLCQCLHEWQLAPAELPAMGYAPTNTHTHAQPKKAI